MGTPALVNAAAMYASASPTNGTLTPRGRIGSSVVTMGAETTCDPSSRLRAYPTAQSRKVCAGMAMMCAASALRRCVVRIGDHFACRQRVPPFR